MPVPTYTAATVSRFIELFQGNRNAYGIHVPGKAAAKGEKASGKSFTRNEPVSSDIYEEHLSGSKSIGIIPVDTNGNVWFCAIDVDKYPLKPTHYCAVISKLNLPLVPFRSKSGGLHLYMFFEKATPAEKALELLETFRCVLGLPRETETFPKQKRLSANKVGNWINLPYYNGKDSTRYAYDENGKPLAVDPGIAYAYSMRTTYQGAQLIISSLPLLTAPPCLQAMYLNGAVREKANNRNTFLFNVTVYLKARFKDEWKEKLKLVNESLPEPLPESEIETSIIRSHEKGSYTYQCDSCLGEWCDKAVCGTREYGKNRNAVSNFTFERLTQVQSNPPYYKWIVSGKEMVFFSEYDLRNQDKFMDYCIRYLRFLPNRLKNEAWTEIINNALRTMEVEEVNIDDDLSDASMWQVYLKEFIFERALASRPSQTSLGQVFHDDNGYWFKAEAFVQYLQDVKKFKVFSAKQTGYMLRRLGFQPARLYDPITKTNIRCWNCSDTIMSNLTGATIKDGEPVSDDKKARALYEKQKKEERSKENKLQELANQLLNVDDTEQELLDFSEDKEPF